MKSLYGQYIAERANQAIVEDEFGFATYMFTEKGVYIEDIYVLPDHRHEHRASKYADEIAKIAREKGCTKMYGSVVPSANHSTASLKVLLAYGFYLDSSTNNFILMVKDI